MSDSTVITFTPGVPPIWMNRIRYFEEPNLWRQVRGRQRSKAMANVVSGSLILLLLMAGFLVMVWSGKWRDEPPRKTNNNEWKFIQER